MSESGRFADACRVRQHGLEHRLQLAGRARDDATPPRLPSAASATPRRPIAMGGRRGADPHAVGCKVPAGAQQVRHGQRVEAQRVGGEDSGLHAHRHFMWCTNCACSSLLDDRFRETEWVDGRSIRASVAVADSKRRGAPIHPNRRDAQHAFQSRTSSS
jgi:hypothetical protein